MEFLHEKSLFECLLKINAKFRKIANVVPSLPPFPYNLKIYIYYPNSMKFYMKNSYLNVKDHHKTERKKICNWQSPSRPSKILKS